MSGRRDFLVELGTEELPPKALKDLSEAFLKGVGDGLEAHRLEHDVAKAYATPRRLAVHVTRLADRQPDREVQSKGPPVKVAFDDKGKPTKAALAFAKKCGVNVDELQREKTDAGEWLSYVATEKGKPVETLLPDIVADALDRLPVPRRMRWGAREDEFVRPVHWLLMLYGKSVVNASLYGVDAGNTTRGHRFHAPAELKIPSPDRYLDLLEKKAYVRAVFAKRRAVIEAAVEAAAHEAGGDAIASAALFDEVAALTEWPVPVTGSFDESYLELPREVIIATLTGHQRYFPVEDKDGKLLPAFITLANLASKEPDRVRDGNERVIRPRLADAAFFWRTDQQTPLGERVDALKNVVYQQGLGSLHDKSMRVAALAGHLAEQGGMDGAAATRAAVLAKCDLLTGMVGEFPELQGTMGRYYALASGESQAVALAIEEQYLPRFAGDALPKSAPGQLLAIADKLDTLAGVFALGKKPSGNRDPFGLRRAALGVIRIALEGGMDINLLQALQAAVGQQPGNKFDRPATADALYDFMIDRLRSYVGDIDAAFSTDMFEAVRARRPASLGDFMSRLDAVMRFMSHEAAISLAAANKRTANILRKSADAAEAELDAGLLADDAERVLYHALLAAEKDVKPLMKNRAYTDALTRLAELRSPVDAFFDDVMVMTDDAAVRRNRVALLAALRELFLDVADLSRLTPPGKE